ncbi:hypothetical protein [Nocardia sp. alder85J]|uniref:hypothetical protein n=1 Tax=Nocardia sp. alder85J TaxID=2862949 RepID=UPI001CD21A74|nr:hypothetical protein [Nocardia sp. alder85J]MCX4091040.1 hypothetical protein [Nocardia sp. alder85J]
MVGEDEFRVVAQPAGHAGAGLDTATAAELVDVGEIPTAAMLGDSFPLEEFEQAFELLTRKTAGRDSIRVALRSE